MRSNNDGGDAALSSGQGPKTPLQDISLCAQDGSETWHQDWTEVIRDLRTFVYVLREHVDHEAHLAGEQISMLV